MDRKYCQMATYSMREGDKETGNVHFLSTFHQRTKTSFYLENDQAYTDLKLGEHRLSPPCSQLSLQIGCYSSVQKVLTQTASKAWGNFIICQIYKLESIFIQPVSPKFLRSEHSKRQVPFRSPVIKLTGFVFKQKCFFSCPQHIILVS